jgi:uncharacterized membrane protein
MADKHQHYGPQGKQDRALEARVEEQRLMLSGPLPASSEFQRYELALPGAADRILAMAEKEAEHRHRLDEKTVTAGIGLAKSGQVLAGIICLSSIALIAYGVYKNAPLTYIPGVFIGLASIISAYTNIGKNK